MPGQDGRAFGEIFPAFQKTAPQVVDTITASGQYRSVPAGSRLFWEGDSCGHIAFVLGGEVRVFKTGSSGREITLYEIGPGETCVLNASCIMSDKLYPADAAAIGDVQLLLLPAPIFRNLVDTSPSFRAFVFEQLSHRLTGIFELLEEIVFGHLDERLYDYLVEKSENNILNSTHQAIANDLGTSREVVSRLLKDFEHQARIELGRGRIILKKFSHPSR